MKLFGKKDAGQQPVVPQLDQYYTDEPRWKVWVRRIVGIVVVLLIVFAIGWAAWAVYNRVTDDGVDEGNNGTDSSQNEGGAIQDGTDTEAGQEDGTSTHDSSSTDEDNHDTTGSATSDPNKGGDASTPAPASDSAAKTMPATGPADTALVVVSAAAVGTLGHYILNRRAKSQK